MSQPCILNNSPIDIVDPIDFAESGPMGFVPVGSNPLVVGSSPLDSIDHVHPNLLDPIVVFVDSIAGFDFGPIHYHHHCSKVLA